VAGACLNRLAGGQLGGSESDFLVVEALHAPGAGGYAEIFRAHDSELLS
jgi:hypothetical protein